MIHDLEIEMLIRSEIDSAFQTRLKNLEVVVEFTELSHLQPVDIAFISGCRKELFSGNKVESMHLAIGFALAEENKDANCEELVIIADKMMYEAKSRYYKESGKDRRRR
jgi:GGDEF domain-containing protein